jgi:hypothetical protein
MRRFRISAQQRNMVSFHARIVSSQAARRNNSVEPDEFLWTLIGWPESKRRPPIGKRFIE